MIIQQVNKTANRAFVNKIIMTVVLCGILLLLADVAFPKEGYLPPKEMQYPIIKLYPNKSLNLVKTLNLAGARNEQLFLQFQLTEADSASFRAGVEAKDATIENLIKVQFLQLCWAPSSTEGSWQPDALLPLEQGIFSTAAPLAIITTIRIPHNLPKGIYTYDLIFADKERTYRQTLKLRVFDFDLPDDLPITILGIFRHYEPSSWFRTGPGKNSEEYLNLLREYYFNIRSQKINALGNPYPFPLGKLTKETKIESFQDYHKIITYALNDLGFQYISIPHLEGWKTIDRPGDTFKPRAHLLFPLYQDYLRRNGWTGRALNYVADEPRKADFSEAFQAFQLAKTQAPAIMTLSAGADPDPKFLEVINIWVMHGGHFSEKELAAAREQGQKRWLYINRLHGIDQPLAHQRLIGWLLYEYQFSGYLLWGLNFWPENPWSAPPGPSDYWRRGTFYYPHPKTGQPVATYRLLSLVRGFEDYQYLMLLDAAHRQGRVP